MAFNAGQFDRDVDGSDMLRLLPPFIAAIWVILLTACATIPVASSAPDNLDAIAEDYVRASLEIGTHEEGYIDAYYGPEAWQTETAADPRSRDELISAVRALTVRIDALETSTTALDQQRADALAGQLHAAEARLFLMMERGQFTFTDEALNLFGVAPNIQALSDYDPVLAHLETLVPGEGNLAERVAAYEAQFVIPADRLDAVMRAAIAECRARTAQHIALPESDTFRLEFVTDKPWSGYNYYQGNATSLIQINTDLPIGISRAVDLGCHEGYPGHHVYNMLLERNLTRQRGWVEYSIYPLYSPQSLIAEGSANYGVTLAFPGDERRAFEADVLYPLAGLDPARAGEYLAIQEALGALTTARFTIARDYLEGRIDRDEAIALTQRYQLQTRERAAQSIDFTDTYRSYVINYGLGEAMVRTYIEAQGGTPDARWAAMERILSEPITPQDLIIEQTGDE